MRILKTIIYIILALVAIFLLLALIAPKESTVTRTVTIDAPPSLVYDNVNSLQDMSNWSPWTEADPDAEGKYTGEEGAVGSEFYWNGNDEIGEGTQTITAIDEGKSIDCHLNFVRPWPGDADAGVVVNPNDNGGSDVTWNFSSTTPFPMNVSNLFMDIDDMLGPMYEKGLSKLKTLVDGKMNSMEIDGFKISMQPINDRYYLGKKAEISFTELGDYFNSTMSTVGAQLGKMGALEKATSSAIYYKWDQENSKTELLAGFFTPDNKGEVKGLDAAKIDAGQAVTIDYTGDYDQSEKAHYAIDKFLKMTGRKSLGMAVEDYLVGPGTEEDSSKWRTKIVYPVK